MAEALGQIAEERAITRLDHLGEKTDVVSELDELVHERRGLVVATDAGECAHHPEGAGDEGSLLLVGPAVAIDQRASAQLVPDGVDG